MSPEGVPAGTSLENCNICGGRVFVPGPDGRMSETGGAPMCANCGSLERHRIIKLVYDRLPDDFLGRCQAIQLSSFECIRGDRFASFQLAPFTPRRGRDAVATDRPDAAFDWVVADHVLQRTRDDRAAFAALLRILRPDGVLHIGVPAPLRRIYTRDHALDADGPTPTYRTYGSDAVNRFRAMAPDILGLQVIARDPASGGWDMIFFLSRTVRMLDPIATAMIAHQIICLRFA